MTLDSGQLSLDPSPCRARVISTNLGGGHGSWLDYSSIFWKGAVGTSASLVVMGQSMPWATDGDPLGWAKWLLLWLQSCRTGFASLDKLTSTQLEGAVAAKTSSSVKETSGSITCQSSTTLSARWCGSLGIGG